MENENNDNSGSINLTGDFIPLVDEGGSKDGDSGATTGKADDRKPGRKAEAIKEVSKKVYISVISKPFTLIGKLKNKEHWKLDTDEEKDVADSYECVARHIPLALGKYFCFINFGVNMLSILVKRVMEDKRIKAEEEPKEKEKDINEPKRIHKQADKSEGKLGRGVRNG